MPVIRTQTTEGAAKGMVTVRAPHELDDQEVVWLQDSLVNQAGLIVRRNGLPAAGAYRKTVSTNAANTTNALGIVSTFDPDGTFRFMVLWYDHLNASDTVLWGSIYDASFNFISRQPLMHCIGTNQPLVGNVHSSILPDGGVHIWVGTNLTVGDYNAASCVWYGAAPTIQYTQNMGAPVSVTLTITGGSNVVTASAADIAKLVPGAVINNIGIIQRINSTTDAILTTPYRGPSTVGPCVVGATMAPYVVRSKGLLNASVGSNTVAGYGTDFSSWCDIARQSPFSNGHVVSQNDYARMFTYATTAATTPTSGLTVTVVRDASLEPFIAYSQPSTTFGINQYPAAFQVACALGPFICWNNANPYLSQRLGGLTCSYGGYTFWANAANYPSSTLTGTPSPKNLTQRVWITGPNHTFECDHSPDGTWFDVKSEKPNDTDITAIASVPSGVVIAKRSSVWLLSGSSPDDFQLNKIADDGCIGPTLMLNYSGGVIWINNSGVWAFNGSGAPINIVEDTVGNVWPSHSANFNFGDGSYFPRTFIYRDHLFISNQIQNNNVFGAFIGNANSGLPTTVVINLKTNAVSLWTNFRVCGFMPPNASTGRIGWALVQTIAVGGALGVPYLVNMDSIMDANGIGAPLTNDNFITTGLSSQTFPLFYMETKRYDLGDAMNRKVWKGFAMEAKFGNPGQTAVLKLDYVLGLNTTGLPLTTSFPDTLGVYKAQKLKQRARDQFNGYRLYEDTANKPTNVIIAPWQLIYKPGRPGAI